MNIAEVTLTCGQVNAVCSVFKAGITPSRIAQEPDQPPANARCNSVATNANAQANSNFRMAHSLSVVLKLSPRDNQGV